MCGIVGAVSTRNIVPILVQGLQRLEYRGYDSCGVAVYADGLKRARSTVARGRTDDPGRRTSSVEGTTGIAHTRWATHGAPAVHNAHPHFSHGPGESASRRPGRIALVHNGIIENHDELRAALQAKGYVFSSQTDTEVIAHLVDSLYEGDLFEAVKAGVTQLHGAYAIAVFCKDEPHRVVGARAGSPLILGVGKEGGENFLASDAMALAGVTDQIVYLEEGDVVDVQLGKYWIVDNGATSRSTRAVKTVQAHSGAAELGPYRHYMQKEIFEQPRAIGDTLRGRRRASCPSCSATARMRVFKEIDSRADPGLRHQLLQRLHRQVLAGGHRQDPDPGRDRQRIPLPRQRAESEDAGRDHQPIRRDGRHAGRAAAMRAAWAWRTR